MTLLSILLQAGGKGGDLTSTIIMMVAIIAIFYFFMIRPQQKRQKKEREAIESLKVGDKVVTIGGVHGRIKEVNDSTFLVEVADGVKIKFEKSAVRPGVEDSSKN